MEPSNNANDLAIDAMLQRINGLASGQTPPNAPPVAAPPVESPVLQQPGEQPGQHQTLVETPPK